MLPTSFKFRVNPYIKTIYPKLGRIQGWKLGTWKELQQSNYSSCPSKVYLKRKSYTPNYVYFILLEPKTLKKNYQTHLLFYFILLPEMLKSKMKRKDTYLDSWRCTSPRMVYSWGMFLPKLDFDFFCFISFMFFILFY